jgi:hypothetical protein
MGLHTSSAMLTLAVAALTSVYVSALELHRTVLDFPQFR